eukprot:TRINITY_DN3401_c0_g1_i3.p1 TRINITY_DN3401_c0_g1~~TRINITY_DN3401_c0_g1_i3.p1  ORF type:complete len:185 (-),score=49.71 TRINITY_DN3401_c0_g1_i3:855-1409(-)
MKTILLFVSFLVIGGFCATWKQPVLDTPTRIKDIVSKWARLYSGKPVSCLEPQFLFTQGVQIETPNTTYYGINGVMRHCEDSYKRFEQAETFVTGEVLVKQHSAAFQKTTLLLTDTGCRIVSHGLATFDFVEGSLLISKWREYYDGANLAGQIQNCTLPFGDDEPEPEPAAASPATQDAPKQEL